MARSNTSSKDIRTLIPDIYSALEKGIEFSDEELDEYAKSFALLMKEKLKAREKKGILRMSNLGSPDRQLWYSVNKPEAREDLEGKTYLKFLYGDIVEFIILMLAKKAGHTIELQQEELDLFGMPGHPDAVIDGVLVDVKSASGYGMKKFKDHSLEKDDPFHYLYQLSSYLEALKNREELQVKKEGAFLAVDKVDGSLVLDKYKKLNIDFEEEVGDKKEMLAKTSPPDRCYEPVADGLSGNMKLPMPCTYCGFKRECHPGLRAFNYSNGVRYLTRVVKEPDVEELK